ncbi:MAG TPA: hypothetical protein VHI31_04585 [Actinomycetota bacterium]|nr:hypothetical protein [Actinomycetota bacterium]
MVEPTDPQLTDEGKPPAGTQEPMGAPGASGQGAGTQGTNAQQDAEGRPTDNPQK